MNRKPPRKYYRDDEFLFEIGVKIKHFRDLHDITIESLANDMEVDFTQIQRMEAGKVNFSVSYLKRIAKALGIEPKDLL